MPGQITSRSATLVSGYTNAEVFVVPEGNRYRMIHASIASRFDTTPIFLPVVHRARLVASTLGQNRVPTGTCQPFEPGIVFGAGEVVSCEVGEPAPLESTCLITGILQPTDRGRRD